MRLSVIKHLFKEK